MLPWLPDDARRSSRRPGAWRPSRRRAGGCRLPFGGEGA